VYEALRKHLSNVREQLFAATALPTHTLLTLLTVLTVLVCRFLTGLANGISAFVLLANAPLYAATAPNFTMIYTVTRPSPEEERERERERWGGGSSFTTAGPLSRFSRFYV
jgi:hypothetical protein